MQSRPLLERWKIPVYSPLLLSRARLYSRATNQNNSLSVQVFNIPSALAAVFLSVSIRHPERERVAASLCASWLPLELGERIEQLGLAV
jgi:hypothetical protein